MNYLHDDKAGHQLIRRRMLVIEKSLRTNYMNLNEFYLGCQRRELRKLKRKHPKLWKTRHVEDGIF